MVTVLRRLEGSGILEEYPTLTAYIARGEARKAYERAFEAQLAVFTASAAGAEWEADRPGRDPMSPK